MRIALAQINPTVGDFAGNEAKILQAARRAEGEGLDLAVFPELTIPGYPPRDLLLKKDFIAQNLAALQRFSWAPPAPLEISKVLLLRAQVSLPLPIAV